MNKLKIKKQLQDMESSITEKDVVFLLVLLRKLLERNNAKSKYKLLIFYADWALHTEKDRLTSGMKNILKMIESEDQKKNSTMELSKFIHMEHLRDEMKQCLTDYNLPLCMVGEDERWNMFVIKLVQFLIDHPINIKTEHAVSAFEVFAFKKMPEGYDHVVMCHMKYKKPQTEKVWQFHLLPNSIC